MFCICSKLQTECNSVDLGLPSGDVPLFEHVLGPVTELMQWIYSWERVLELVDRPTGHVLGGPTRLEVPPEVQQRCCMFVPPACTTLALFPLLGRTRPQPWCPIPIFCSLSGFAVFIPGDTAV